MLIETYSQRTFERARAFYKARGYAELGRIANYLPDGSAMVVYGKQLLTSADDQPGLCGKITRRTGTRGS
jgi:hypothetical protein